MLEQVGKLLKKALRAYYANPRKAPGRAMSWFLGIFSGLRPATCC